MTIARWPAIIVCTAHPRGKNPGGHATPPSDSEPTKIGGFELLATVGKGGMGVVFRARQVSMDRIVALKVLPPDLAKNKAYVARFLREARSAAKLNHPNIVQGIDVGHAGSHYYFAMEFVDGTTVKEMLKAKGRLDEKSALNIVGAVARALEHARKHGIIHRDIKPDNIMVTREGVVKLADLGLARTTEKPDTMTIEGTALGTPYYMAPEQVRGETSLDTRADIYSLGATLFHMVTGHFPFTGPNAGAIMARHLSDPAPSARDKHPEVSRATDELIQRMMAKDPADRPQTPTKLIHEVKDALAGKLHLRQTPVGRRPTARGRAHGTAGPRPTASGLRPPRSSKATWLTVAAVAVIAIIVAVVALRRGSKPAEQAKRTRSATSSPIHPSTPRSIPSAPKQTPKADDLLQSDLAALRTSAADLASKDKFAEAMKQADLLALKHPTAVAEIDKVRQGIAALAERRYDALSRAADAAIEAKNFAKAREALKPVASFGIAELAERAKKRLAEIASREKGAAAWAKWDEVKAAASELVAEGKLDEAAKLLEDAKQLPLSEISDLIAEQMKSIEAAKRKAAKAALAAYQAQSDKVWALFKERKYPEAEKLLAAIAGGAALPHDLYNADLRAAKLLKEFWAAVERGVMARKGKFVSIAGRGGNVESVKDGQVTFKAGAMRFTAPLLGMNAAQAAAIAALKDDEHGSLVKAIFLLAEGEKLDDAEKLLAAAGNLPGLACYKDRLATLTLGAAEVAARKAWAKIEASAKPKPTKAEAKRLLALLDAFEKAHAGTKHFASVRDKLTELRAQAQPGPKEPEWVRLFDGKSLDRWEPEGARWSVEEGVIAVAVGAQDTTLTFRGRSYDNFDFEAEAMNMPGSSGIRFGVLFRRGGPRYQTFCLNATFKALQFYAGGVWRGAIEGVSVTPIIQKRPSFEPGQWYKVRVKCAGKKIECYLDDRLVARGTDTALRKGYVGLAVHRSRVRFRNIRIRPLAGAAEAPKPGEWQSLFDGKSLRGWRASMAPDCGSRWRGRRKEPVGNESVGDEIVCPRFRGHASGLSRTP